MENFIVSARKYRPTTFDDVVGQQALANTLKRAIVSHKLASAYLFCGPRGVGKTTCARIFAKAINCLNPKEDGEACNECESCISFNDQRSMNVQELNAAANNSVDDIREIIDQVRIPPQLGKYKVIILDEVHMLSQAAANALLKTLEEPPSYVIFILATTEKQKMLPTILSRCQIFDFNRMTINDIVGELKMVAEKEQIKYEERALNIIAQKADGGMRDSLSIFDQVTNFSEGNITYESVLKCLNVLDYDYYFKMTEALIGHQISQSLLLFNEIVEKGFSGGSFIGGMASHLRDLLVSRDEVTVKLLDAADNVKQRYVEQARQCSEKFLYRAIRLCERCSNEYRYSLNKRLSVEITLIEAAQMTDSDESVGPGPARKLKPLFKETNSAAHKSETASPTVVAQAVTSKAAPAASPAVPTPSVSPTQKKSQKQLLLHPTPSIRINAPAEEKNELSEEMPAAVVPTLGEKAFDEKALKYFWNQYAKDLPREGAAISGRMESMDVLLLADSQVEVHVNNELVRKFMAPEIPKIENYLQQKLDNKNLKIIMKVLVSEKQSMRHNPGELFDKVVEEHRGIAKLKSELGLILD